MQMWFSEYHTVNVKLDVRIEEQLFSGKSEYQKIDVFKSYEFGKMAALDGEIVFSDADEFIYDEMVTHVPMAVHPNAKKILIIGGGDGGVAKELIKYPFVEKIDVVETDKMFVDVCRKFFPEVACGLEGKRIDNPNTHGTGCTLSSAIASNLAKGRDLETSVKYAKNYISGALAAMLDLGKGSGPMDHAFAIEGEY